MAPSQDFSRALSLAGSVLEQKMCLDEALLVASASNLLNALVESLNVLADGPVFVLAELENRVHSGEAQYAVEQRIPRLEVPPELANWKDRKSAASTEWIDAALADIDNRIGRLQEAERDILGQLDFLQTVTKNQSTPPNPWLSGVIIMSVGLGLSLVLTLMLGTRIVGLMAFVFVTMIAAVSSMRDWQQYEIFMEKARKEEERRQAKRDQCAKNLDNINAELAAIKVETNKILARLEMVGESDLQNALASYPRLFWMTSQQEDQKVAE
jgi:hypothetical protein